MPARSRARGCHAGARGAAERGCCSRTGRAARRAAAFATPAAREPLGCRRGRGARGSAATARPRAPPALAPRTARTRARAAPHAAPRRGPRAPAAPRAPHRRARAAPAAHANRCGRRGAARWRAAAPAAWGRPAALPPSHKPPDPRPPRPNTPKKPLLARGGRLLKHAVSICRAPRAPAPPLCALARCAPTPRAGPRAGLRASGRPCARRPPPGGALPRPHDPSVALVSILDRP
jgi:hypothetical protein